MENNGRMVAVVQGLQDSGLTVTLLDGGNQYTLMPNKLVNQQKQPQLRCRPSVNCASQYAANESSGPTVGSNRENGIQATDGRYTSTYRMMHCNVNPTSPPQIVTEFPPQKPEVIHGHGNFVIGGCGSGETTRPVIKKNSFRGGMVWPDKGSVCSSRASMQSDAFANSLRKYPNISPDRSTEIVQRLISFTQAKNLSKNQHKYSCSPTRNSTECESSKQTFILERNTSRNSVTGKVFYNPQENVASKNRMNERSPVKERSSNFLVEENVDSRDRHPFSKTNEVRYYRDTARKNLLHGFRHPEVSSNNSVNMEIQAAAPMESKEILTLPRIVPLQRTIASPLSPIQSTTDRRIGEASKPMLSSYTDLTHIYSSKSIQVKLPLDDKVKIGSSSFDLRGKYKHKRSRSEEELDTIKKITPYNSLYLQDQPRNTPSVDEIFSQRKGGQCKEKRICQNCRHIYGNFDILRRSVSNNTYFREDFQLNADQSIKSNDLKKISRHYYTDENDLVNKDRYNFETYDSDTKESSGFFNATNDSRNKFAYCATKDLNNKFVERKRNHRKGTRHLSKPINIYRKRFGNRFNNNKKYLKMTQEQIKNLIDLDILAFTQKYWLSISTNNLYDLVEELFELFVMDFDNTTFHNKVNMSKKIKNVLQNRGLSEFQSTYLTNILTEHWEEEFSTPNDNNLQLSSSNFMSKTLMVFPNITQDLSQYTQEKNNRNTQQNDYSINEISEKDIDAIVKVYIGQISNKIDEWLSDFLISQTHDAETRQAIINDLANDIVDRHKYLELNQLIKTSEKLELEHLKYQIFKLIHKFGIDDMALVDHGIDLMKKIENIAVPIFYIHQKNKLTEKRPSLKVESEQFNQKVIESSNTGASSSRQLTSPNDKCCARQTCKRNRASLGANMNLKESGRNYQETTSSRRMSLPGKLVFTNTEYNEKLKTSQPVPKEQRQRYTNTATDNIPAKRNGLFSGGIIIKDDENNNNKNNTNIQMKLLDKGDINTATEQYLKEWVEKIPLAITSTEIQNAAEIVRTDIYNNILQSIKKLRSDLAIFNNRFLFEDLLDDEIEKVINKLPQSSELNLKKHILKVMLIEKISDINELMKTSTKSYKQQLVENLKENLPRLTSSEIENPDFIQLYEELQILNLVEDFIICSRYQNDDPVTAEAYRKKLLKRTENFVEELKAHHKKALKNIDMRLYLKDILDTLINVPLPSEETIEKEAVEILLSIEIDKWFADLPLIQSNDYVEQLHRRRLKNNLAKQILDLEKNSNRNCSVLDNPLKHEISLFLEKAPLKYGESLNINAMVDDLINVLKNRPTSIRNGSRKVVFNEQGYEEFSKNIPLSSTYNKEFCENIESQNRSSPSTKPIQAIDASQQLHSGYYHNTSKLHFDDLMLDKNSPNANLSLIQMPNYETFNKTRPRSSSLEQKSLPHWYTLHDSKQEYSQSPISMNNLKNHNITAKSQTDDQRLDNKCCSDDFVDYGTMEGLHFRPPLMNDGSEGNWYTLQESNESKHSPQSNKLQSSYKNSRFEPHPINISGQMDAQDWINRTEHHNVPQQECIEPKQYLENMEPDDYAVQQRREFLSPNRRGSPNNLNEQKSMASGSQDKDVRRRSDNLIVDENYSSPLGVDRRRLENPNISQRTMKLDNYAGHHEVPYYPTYPKEPRRYKETRSLTLPNIEEQRSSNHQANQPDLFYRSTDREGLKQTTDFNRNTKSKKDKFSSPENPSGYYQPSIFLPPPGYVPLRVGTKKDNMPDISLQERLQRDAKSEEENEEDDEVRCPCVEKVWKSKRRYRYCPLEQYDGFPMCMTSPYFYPYFH